MSIGLGIGLALCSCACSACGYTLQKIAHLRHDAALAALAQKPIQSVTPSTGAGDYSEPAGAPRSPSPDPSEKGVPAPSFVRFWQFGAGLALLIIGTVFAAFVLGLAPQSTLAPLGSVTMILNTILSWKFLGEAFTRVDLASVMLMATGTTIAVLFGKGSDPKYTLDTVIHLFVDRPAAWSLALCSGVCIAAATTYVYTIGRTPVDALTPATRSLDVFCRSFLGAAWSGYSNWASKAVVEVVFSAVSVRTLTDIARPEFVLFLCIMVGSLLMQLKCLNLGLAKYDSSIVVRCYQAMLACHTTLSGLVYFDEAGQQSGTSITLFVLGFCTVLVGIMVGMKRSPVSVGKGEQPEPVDGPSPQGFVHTTSASGQPATRSDKFVKLDEDP